MKKGSDHQKGQLVPFTQSSETLYKKGMAVYQKGQFDKAIKYLGKAAELEPDEPMIPLQIAMIETELGEFQQSNERLKSIEAVDPTMTEVHYLMANNFAHLGLFQEAYRHVNVYLSEEPDGEFTEDAEDLLELLALEDEEGFDEEFEQDELIVHQEKAGKYLAEGKFEQAVELLESVVERFPDYWSAYNNLALAYFYQGETEQASAILTEVLHRNPGNLHALCNLAVFYHYEERTKELEELMDALERIRPFMVEHRFKLGATFALVGRHEQAYGWLKSLVKRGFEGDSGFYYWLSHSAWHSGHKDVAENAWKRVISDQPDKAGQEPWALKPYADNEETLEDLYPEERMFLLFKEVQSSINILEQEPPEFFTGVELQYYRLLQNPYIQTHPLNRAHDVARELKRHYDLQNKDYQGLFYMWFYIMYHAAEDDYAFKNAQALAAAVEYVWLKVKGNPKSQKEVAMKYDVSAAALAKYRDEIKPYLP
ncbi:tetratricopeptide repeat protein [Jeotgalibacillus aurantiacus]|uniref:tetratricopeptide repeat protein n=1 Tax=Jeotgalibacillus aurantiacus TaxID=2763266 RepID=UPI001D0B69AD|nr:tetratricopeptide repeat protein [Jeotgalibacillus aurantiacus]